MKRHIKIKTYLLLLAWLVIFLHNVIPHTHLDEQPNHCHSLFHKIIAVNHHHGHETEISGASDHRSNVCHFSPVFFHAQDFGQLALITFSSYFISPVPDRIEKLYIPGSDEPCNSQGNESNHLRAPPVS